MPQSVRRRSNLVAYLVALGFVASACSSSREASSAPSTTAHREVAAPADVIAAASSLLAVDPVDTRTVELAPVGGSVPQRAIAITGGRARLEGTVTFDGKPISGATVRLERYADDSVGSVDLTTATNGGWVAEGIVGGRYVIRAWKAPNLALQRAQALFLADDGGRQVPLQLVGVIPGEVTLTAALSDDTPTVGTPVDLTITVTFDRGKKTEPVPNVTVSFVEFPDWDLAEGIADITDADGEAHWTASCNAAGRHSVTVDVSGTSHELTFPTCAAKKGKKNGHTSTTDAGTSDTGKAGK